MVKTLGQLHWAMEYPDVWSNIILVCLLRVTLDEINGWIGKVNKADCSI